MNEAIYPDLAGRVGLVTGGASGIGAAIARAMAAQGMAVGVLDLDVEAGAALARDLGGRVAFERVDLRDVAATQAAIARLRSALGPITHLVNNAARDDRHRIDEVTPDY